MPLRFSPELRKINEDFLRNLAKNRLTVNIMVVETRHDMYGNPTNCIKILTVLGNAIFDYSLEFGSACKLPCYKNRTVGVYGYQDIKDAVRDQFKKIGIENVELVRVLT